MAAVDKPDLSDRKAWEVAFVSAIHNSRKFDRRNGADWCLSSGEVIYVYMSRCMSDGEESVVVREGQRRDGPEGFSCIKTIK